MSDERPVEEVVQVESDGSTPADELAAFDSGFSGTLDAPTDTPPADKADEPNQVVESPEVSTEPVVQVPTVPKLSDEEIRSLLTKVGTVDELRASLEKLRGDAFGKVGGLERTLKQLQEGTSFGQPIEVKPEDLAELESEFPGLNLTSSLAKGLTRVLGKMKAGGTAPSVLSKEEVDSQIASRIEEERKKNAVDRLSDMHEDWQAVVGPPDSATEFRTWLKAQGPEKEQAFLASWDPRHLGKRISEFKESKKAATTSRVSATPARPANSRAQRLAEAVPIRGGGVAVPKGKVNEDEAAFDAGFAGR